MDDDIMGEYLRAMRENKDARTADESFASATVAAQAIRLCDDDPLATLTSEEAFRRAKLFRSIAAHALRAAQICDHHAAVQLREVA